MRSTHVTAAHVQKRPLIELNSPTIPVDVSGFIQANLGNIIINIMLTQLAHTLINIYINLHTITFVYYILIHMQSIPKPKLNQ